ncbi:hypothetical protein ACQPZP_14845 [Spirillospora sp. CA-142024]|uniref:hypothetical protein n=1 Tax=Spirillospora sp. CA-142024 TaxID=3240036 RepID=UPI003D8D4E23
MQAAVRSGQAAKVVAKITAAFGDLQGRPDDGVLRQSPPPSPRGDRRDGEPAVARVL